MRTERILPVVFTLLSASIHLPAATIDDFESVQQWIAAPSDGVELRIGTDTGIEGRAMRLDFDFRGGAGYAIARRPFVAPLPDDYELSFFIRGDAPPNTLEIKLLDSSGESVWWVNRRHMSFPAEWTRMRLKKRHFEFAWGPSGGAPLTEISAVEIVVTASTGGSGTVWIDELRLDPLEPRPATYPPPLAVSTSAGARRTVDGDLDSIWRSTGDADLVIDFGVRRELGGLTLVWQDGAHAADYDVEVSDDRKQWFNIARVRESRGATDTLYLPDTDTRFLRIRPIRPSGEVIALREVQIEPLSISESRNQFLATLASRERRGLYPRYLQGEQTYWTVVGETDSEREALLNTDGVLEPDAAGYMVEPFLYSGDELTTWADVNSSQSLADDSLPIPTVRWTRSGDSPILEVTAFAREAAIYARYRISNPTANAVETRLYLAIRPLQVNPPWQFLNIPGGSSRIQRVARRDGIVEVDERRIVPLTPNARFGATTHDAGDVSELIARGELPLTRVVEDPSGAASAALAFDLVIGADATEDVWIMFPDSATHPEPTVTQAERALLRTADLWRSRLARFHIELPGGAARVADVVRSNVAYILINQDEGAIQPGSRAYDRSWIRDGSLTSAALLRLGYMDSVRDFIDWFAPYQFPSGKVPCCVDRRGPDPVPEHDSSGQLIYLLAEYYRHTGDVALLERHWPHVQRAVEWLESLVAQRSTSEYESGDKRAYYGLVPESISHEGYSAKPMHSYWDDFFTLRGLEDAVLIASVLGHTSRAAAYEEFESSFRRNLIASIAATQRMHGIDFIPGSVELGDFDATSTTIALTPGEEAHNLRGVGLQETFDRYWREALARMEADSWEAYTPYETRAVGTFVRLGQRDRAHRLMQWLMQDIRPREWNHWAEVVFREPTTPKFIGDMPHTWVGSDFIRSVLDMFAYEEGERLVVGHGVPDEWTRGEGAKVRGLRTHFGVLDLEMQRRGGQLEITIGGSARPPGGAVIRPELPAGAQASVNGVEVAIVDGEIAVPALPATVIVRGF